MVIYALVSSFVPFIDMINFINILKTAENLIAILRVNVFWLSNLPSSRMSSSIKPRIYLLIFVTILK
jgi:hypothetical protein